MGPQGNARMRACMCMGRPWLPPFTSPCKRPCLSHPLPPQRRWTSLPRGCSQMARWVGCRVVDLHALVGRWVQGSQGQQPARQASGEEALTLYSASPSRPARVHGSLLHMQTLQPSSHAFPMRAHTCLHMCVRHMHG